MLSGSAGAWTYARAAGDEGSPIRRRDPAVPDRQPYEKPTVAEGLKPAPLGDEVRLDDDTEDRARANVTLGEVVEEDLDSPHTPSRRLADDGGAAGFDVPTEPWEWPEDEEVAPRHARDTDDLPPL
jgi:hypothetical protein